VDAGLARVRLDAQDELLRALDAGLVAHGPGGVHHEVEQRLLDEPLVHADHDGVAGELRAQHDPGLIALGMEEVAQLLHQPHQVLAAGVEPDAPGELEEVAQDPAEPLDLAAQRVEAPHQARLLLLLHRRLAQGLAQELGVEADGGERILDLVGQAAGHRAQLGQPLRLRRAALRVTGPPLRPLQQQPAQRQHGDGAQRHAQEQPLDAVHRW
jgi:hypothetical protein